MKTQVLTLHLAVADSGLQWVLSGLQWILSGLKGLFCPKDSAIPCWSFLKKKLILHCRLIQNVPGLSQGRPLYHPGQSYEQTHTRGRCQPPRMAHGSLSCFGCTQTGIKNKISKDMWNPNSQKNGKQCRPDLQADPPLKVHTSGDTHWCDQKPCLSKKI